MHSTLRRLGIISFILAILNLLATLMLVFYFIEMPAFAARFTWILYTFSASIGNALISWGLFDFSKEMERENNSNSEYIHRLAKRIKELEERVL